jgi:preprotein translocase subunit SecA
MDRMGLKEGEVITHSMVSKSIERAQKKVEENNFGMRKRLLEYDDVMNAQRKAIYRKRKNALFGDRLDIDIDNMFFDVSENVVVSHTKAEYKEFELELLRMVGIESPVTEQEYESADDNVVINKVYDGLRASYDRKNGKIAEKAMPQIKHVHETMADQYKNIVFPLTDGKKEVQLVINLEEAYNTAGANITTAFEKNITLSMIDNEWKEHLREMDDLRSAVSNAQYEQKDPLLIYKMESFELFKGMLARLNTETIELLVKLNIPETQEIQSTNKQVTSQSNYDKAQTSSDAAEKSSGREGYDEAIRNSGGNRPQVKQTPVTVEKTTGRNEPCPCGSGKKYKQCHGK